jgi:aspartyl-tRNA(Asn)/glutamyl-tRNA(Gln) amidotransferase subunit A
VSADPTGWTARRQAAALAAGETTARALLEAHLERIDRDDGAVGAFWTLDAEGARAAADETDGRRRAGRARGLFDGVPIAIKDNIDVAGLPTTAGVAAYRGRMATRDAPATARVRAAGFVVLGKLAMHEGALGATTEAPGFGRCQNPLRLGFTPGGSSGGSGAAVAARFVPLALGTDTLGSVRIPAAYCGVFGFKPTAGLISRVGVVPLSTTLDTIGVVARDAWDAAMATAILAGEDAADPRSRSPPAGWKAEPSAGARMGGLRFGVPAALESIPIEEALVEALERAADLLRSGGATVVRVALDGWAPGAARRAGLLLAEAEAAVAHAALIDDPAAASIAFRSALSYGRVASSAKLVATLETLARARASARRALRDVDALLMPTAPQRAFPHGVAPPEDQADLTALASIAGLPAVAAPWPAGDGDLPASVQVVGRPFDEARLVAVAEALTVP